MKNWWWKFVRSSVLEKKALLHSFFGMLFLKVLLAVLPFAWFKKIYFAQLKNSSKRDISAYKIAIFRWESFMPAFFTCMHQSLFLKLLMPHWTVHFGIRKTNKVEGHAWCEQAGEPVFGYRPTENFTKVWEW